MEMNWISVDERLPVDGTYLCFKGGFIDVCTILYGNWVINSFGDTKVTHWMPLPAAPVTE